MDSQNPTMTQPPAQAVTAKKAAATAAAPAAAAQPAAAEAVVLTREELNALLAQAATQAVEQMRLNPPKENTVLVARPERDKEAETERILQGFTDRAAAREALMAQGHFRFQVACPSQPRADRVVRAGSKPKDDATEAEVAQLIQLAQYEAAAKYSQYYGIIATLEVGKQVTAAYLDDQPEPPAAA